MGFVNVYKYCQFLYIIDMSSLIKCLRLRVCLLAGMLVMTACSTKELKLLVLDADSERMAFGSERLVTGLESHGYRVVLESKPDKADLVVGLLRDEAFIGLAEERGINFSDTLRAEGFAIESSQGVIFAGGSDESGCLYACLELIEQLQTKGKLSFDIHMHEQPEMLMRGTCIGLQKPEYMPGRKIYEYPYTPELFPWFYDKALWIDYLDLLVENRYNSLYLWNGHPFASLVKLDDYPYALEVDEETFRMNEDIFDFITREADKRGIWIIQMFYNIIVSQPFAEHHNISTQDRSRPILPFVSDYTRKSVAAFIEKYPHVGLMVALGEAMSGIENDIAWFTQTIIPGVQDGLKALGSEEEPPIVLRGHDTDAAKVMAEATKIYSNLYTVHKYNGEALTTYEPQDSWATIHQDLSAIGTVHISNVHILANLEPFRYASPDFIQMSVKAMQDIQGANGLHLYPQASYWDWPYTADKAEPRLRQIDRDRLWYKAWGRYAWKRDRNRQAEKDYWSSELAGEFGLGKEDGSKALKAMEETGEIAPKLLRTFGISDGNRQTLLLGMFMSQLVNPYKYRMYPNFIASSGPDKEILVDWAEKEWKQLPHHGETPPQIIEEVVAHAREAVRAIEQIESPKDSTHLAFERWKNDIYCYQDFALFFSEKVLAATHVLRYKYSNDVADLEKAEPHLRKSVAYYEVLASRTRETYLYANSMQTDLRRIPITGRDGANKHWDDLLPLYQDELNNFVRNLKRVKEAGADFEGAPAVEALKAAKVTVLNPEANWVPLKPGQRLFVDRENRLGKISAELEGLTALSFSGDKQIQQGTELHFTNTEAVKVVVGYFNGHSYTILDPPTLETNAMANERGQADVQIANALSIDDMWPVNVYTYDYEPGTHRLPLGKGLVLVLGFAEGEQELFARDAGIVGEGEERVIDWLFY